MFVRRIGKTLIAVGICILIGSTGIGSIAGIAGTFALGMASVAAGAVLSGGENR